MGSIAKCINSGGMSRKNGISMREDWVLKMGSRIVLRSANGYLWSCLIVFVSDKVFMFYYVFFDLIGLSTSLTVQMRDP